MRRGRWMVKPDAYHAATASSDRYAVSHSCPVWNWIAITISVKRIFVRYSNHVDIPLKCESIIGRRCDPRFARPAVVADRVAADINKRLHGPRSPIPLLPYDDV